jgi:hypothetical protein
MDQICLVLPIVRGKMEMARRFHRELEASRKDEYDASERRIGISKELWYIAQIPGGNAFVAYIESEDFSRALSLFARSRDGFDRWFKGELFATTGIDLNDPPEIALPELASSYQVA